MAQPPADPAPDPAPESGAPGPHEGHREHGGHDGHRERGEHGGHDGHRERGEHGGHDGHRERGGHDGHGRPGRPAPGRAAPRRPEAGRPGDGPGSADHRRLAAVVHTAFFLLLGASLARFLLRHPGEPRTPWILALSLALALLYVLGPAVGAGGTEPGPAGASAAPRARPRPRPRRLVWLGLVVATWMVIVLLAPSFAWCAVPLFYTALRTLPARAAIVLVALLTAFVVGAQLRLATAFDPNLILAPPAVAALATAVFVHMERQAQAQRALIDDLIRTRRELAATERREGTLAERQRLSMEIHDTLAQGLSSQQMLLQAADRTWESDPAAARSHVRTATGIAARGLAEARRLVHDLAPPQLDGGAGLADALRALDAGPEVTVRFHLEGVPVPLPGRTESALLRIAQGALANVREHAGARTAALTLSFLGDQVLLDIADDGRGFAVPAGGAGPDGSGRGHGLPAMRARVRQLGGTLTVESTPGEGTFLSVSVPLPGPGGPDPAEPTRRGAPTRPTEPMEPTAPTSPTASGGPAGPDGPPVAPGRPDHRADARADARPEEPR
ncbi:sensor histidine kinase [Streptomyces sp. NPDC097619]|uniref:sensor histidine kinase n=1 Tax=Streptomyces sp. NPDC097619 TaxID=3157228 RepID=UPI003329EEDF